MELNNADKINGGNKSYHRLSKLDLNAIPRGNASQIRLWIRNIENSVISDTPKGNKFIFTILPFGWECRHSEEPEDDITLGIPSSMEELGSMIKEGRFFGTIMEKVVYHETESAANKLSGVVKNEANGTESDTCEGLKAEFVKFFTGGRSTSTLAVFFKIEATQVRDVLRLAIRTIMSFGASSLRPQLHRGLIRNWNQYKSSLLEWKGCKTEQPSIIDARAIVRDAGRLNSCTVEYPFLQKI